MGSNPNAAWFDWCFQKEPSMAKKETQEQGELIDVDHPEAKTLRRLGRAYKKALDARMEALETEVSSKKKILEKMKDESAIPPTHLPGRRREHRRQGGRSRSGDLLRDWGPKTDFWPADLTGDLRVDATDLAELLHNWSH
jgi:hypothetical protein